MAVNHSQIAASADMILLRDSTFWDFAQFHVPQYSLPVSWPTCNNTHTHTHMHTLRKHSSSEPQD